MKKNKQYSKTLPYIFYWGCDKYHWIRFYKKYSYSILSGDILNYNPIFTILYDHGKISINKY